MIPSVYIETTIPSYYHETRRSALVQAWRTITRRWWDEYRHGYLLYTSRLVLAELQQAPQTKARAALALLENVVILDEPKELKAVADYYVEQRAMPAGASGDAFHLALASLQKMDFLLTWNCQHLANANKVRHLTVLNGRLGLAMPVITTPLNLIPED
ncbi:MAG: type II toxin-antitoxin system VapC family toxin [Phycisphaerae bacterium]|nr:type II toxin-antitoxin system VapC family toxin [Phycisphaerae bacterium]